MGYISSFLGHPIRNEIPILSNRVSIHGSATVTRPDAPCCNCQCGQRRNPTDPLPSDPLPETTAAEGIQHVRAPEGVTPELQFSRTPSLPLPPIRGRTRRRNSAAAQRESAQYLEPASIAANFLAIPHENEANPGEEVLELNTFRRQES